MKIFPLLVFLLHAFYSSFAQETNPVKSISDASKNYHDYRLETTDPPYSLSKINALESKIKVASDEDDEHSVLDQKIYLTLSFREKFTYHMVHPESYSQNCDGMPVVQDEEKKIFAELPDVFGEDSWSSRQRKFFLANRDSVIMLMKDCIQKDKRIGLNFKHVIVDINAKEMIPFMISAYNIDKKDHDILTILMLLMKDNEYGQFLVSLSYKKLYADRNSSYKAFLNFNTENEALIIKRVTDFYSGLPK